MKKLLGYFPLLIDSQATLRCNQQPWYQESQNALKDGRNLKLPWYSSYVICREEYRRLKERKQPFENRLNSISTSIFNRNAKTRHVQIATVLCSSSVLVTQYSQCQQDNAVCIPNQLFLLVFHGSLDIGHMLGGLQQTNLCTSTCTSDRQFNRESYMLHYLVNQVDLLDKSTGNFTVTHFFFVSQICFHQTSSFQLIVCVTQSLDGPISEKEMSYAGVAAMVH